MACRELAALRLGLMNLAGIDDDHERQHELKELGDAINADGPFKSMTEATNFKDLQAFFQASLAELNDRVAKCDESDPKLGYYRSLIILTKKVEQDMDNQLRSLNQLFQDLDEIHHYTHEVYPA